MFEYIIDPAYHLVGMRQTSFVMYKTPAILHQIQTLYGKTSLGDLDAPLLYLHDPMNRNQPVEGMIWEIE